MQLRESCVRIAHRDQRRSQRVAGVTLDRPRSPIACATRSPARTPRRRRGCPRQHQLLALGREDLARPASVRRARGARPRRVLQDSSGSPLEHPEVAAPALVHETGGHRIGVGVDLLGGGADEVERAVGAARHLGLVRRVPHRVDVPHPLRASASGTWDQSSSTRSTCASASLYAYMLLGRPRRVEGRTPARAGAVVRGVPVARQLARELAAVRRRTTPDARRGARRRGRATRPGRPARDRLRRLLAPARGGSGIRVRRSSATRSVARPPHGRVEQPRVVETGDRREEAVVDGRPITAAPRSTCCVSSDNASTRASTMSRSVGGSDVRRRAPAASSSSAKNALPSERSNVRSTSSGPGS